MPGRASTCLNLALARLALGRAPDALQALAPLPQPPAGGGVLPPATAAEAWALAARAHATVGDAAGELDALGRLDTVAGADAGRAYRRGMLLLQLERPADALAAFDAGLRLDPAHAGAWTRRGSLLREAGRLDEAAGCFRQALAHGGDPALNRWFLAAVSGDPAVPPAPPTHDVQALFDGYAEGFDDHLVGRLDCRAHAAIVDVLPAGRRWAAAADLGCGTGLCGPLLRPRAGRLVGVDLSLRMLVQARERGVYDRLDEADLVAWLQACDERFERVTAADVFIDVGDLAPVFAQVARARLPGGDFAFSVETPAPGGEGAPTPMSLGP